MEASPEQQLHAWIQYLRDLGVYDLYRRESPGVVLTPEAADRLLSRLRDVVSREKPAGSAAPLPASAQLVRRELPTAQRSPASAHNPSSASALRTPEAHVAPEPRRPVSYRQGEGTQGRAAGEPVRSSAAAELPPELAAPMPKPSPLESLFPQPSLPVPAGERSAALTRLQEEIGDCTRCPLAYAGRHTIVFGEGDPSADLFFVGEGPGADEDESGRPFVGKAGQLLNNMIGAMGLQREQVFIANIVKCRPPGNRTPEFAEASTCSQFLLKQIDIVRPRVIVALGATAATYVLGVRQSLASLRGQWFQSRGAKVAVTYHPAFLLRDPRQKAEAWKDLQRVMTELGLKATTRSSAAANPG